MSDEVSATPPIERTHDARSEVSLPPEIQLLCKRAEHVRDEGIARLGREKRRRENNPLDYNIGLLRVDDTLSQFSSLSEELKTYEPKVPKAVADARERAVAIKRGEKNVATSEVVTDIEQYNLECMKIIQTRQRLAKTIRGERSAVALARIRKIVAGESVPEGAFDKKTDEELLRDVIKDIQEYPSKKSEYDEYVTERKAPEDALEVASEGVDKKAEQKNLPTLTPSEEPTEATIATKYGFTEPTCKRIKDAAEFYTEDADRKIEEFWKRYRENEAAQLEKAALAQVAPNDQRVLDLYEAKYKGMEDAVGTAREMIETCKKDYLDNLKGEAEEVRTKIADELQHALSDNAIIAGYRADAGRSAKDFALTQIPDSITGITVGAVAMFAESASLDGAIASEVEKVKKAQEQLETLKKNLEEVLKLTTKLRDLKSQRTALDTKLPIHWRVRAKSLHSHFDKQIGATEAFLKEAVKKLPGIPADFVPDPDFPLDDVALQMLITKMETSIESLKRKGTEELMVGQYIAYVKNRSTALIELDKQCVETLKKGGIEISDLVVAVGDLPDMSGISKASIDKEARIRQETMELFGIHAETAPPADNGEAPTITPDLPKTLDEVIAQTNAVDSIRNLLDLRSKLKAQQLWKDNKDQLTAIFEKKLQELYEATKAKDLPPGLWHYGVRPVGYERTSDMEAALDRYKESFADVISPADYSLWITLLGKVVPEGLTEAEVLSMVRLSKTIHSEGNKRIAQHEEEAQRKKDAAKMPEGAIPPLQPETPFSMPMGVDHVDRAHLESIRSPLEVKSSVDVQGKVVFVGIHDVFTDSGQEIEWGIEGLDNPTDIRSVPRAFIFSSNGGPEITYVQPYVNGGEYSKQYGPYVVIVSAEKAADTSYSVRAELLRRKQPQPSPEALVVPETTRNRFALIRGLLNRLRARDMSEDSPERQNIIARIRIEIAAIRVVIPQIIPETFAAYRDMFEMFLSAVIRVIEHYPTSGDPWYDAMKRIDDLNEFLDDPIAAIRKAITSRDKRRASLLPTGMAEPEDPIPPPSNPEEDTEKSEKVQRLKTEAALVLTELTTPISQKIDRRSPEVGMLRRFRNITPLELADPDSFVLRLGGETGIITSLIEEARMQRTQITQEITTVLEHGPNGRNPVARLRYDRAMRPLISALQAGLQELDTLINSLEAFSGRIASSRSYGLDLLIRLRAIEDQISDLDGDASEHYAEILVTLDGELSNNTTLRRGEAEQFSADIRYTIERTQEAVSQMVANYAKPVRPEEPFVIDEVTSEEERPIHVTPLPPHLGVEVAPKPEELVAGAIPTAERAGLGGEVARAYDAVVVFAQSLGDREAAAASGLRGWAEGLPNIPVLKRLALEYGAQAQAIAVLGGLGEENRGLLIRERMQRAGELMLEAVINGFGASGELISFLERGGVNVVEASLIPELIQLADTDEGHGFERRIVDLITQASESALGGGEGRGVFGQLARALFANEELRDELARRLCANGDWSRVRDKVRESLKNNVSPKVEAVPGEMGPQESEVITPVDTPLSVLAATITPGAIAKLNSAGITTVGQLAEASNNVLRRVIGQGGNRQTLDKYKKAAANYLRDH